MQTTHVVGKKGGRICQESVGDGVRVLEEVKLVCNKRNLETFLPWPPPSPPVGISQEQDIIDKIFIC